MDDFALKEPHFEYKDKIENNKFNKLRSQVEQGNLWGFVLIIISISAVIGAIALPPIRGLFIIFALLGFVVGTVELVGFYYGCTPKAVGLKKNQEVWVIKDNQKYKGILNSLIPGDNRFEVSVIIDGESKICKVNLRYLFLSENDVNEFINYAENYNDLQIKPYHEEWEKDINFMQYYRERCWFLVDGEKIVTEYIEYKEDQLNEIEKKQDIKNKIDKYKE